MTVNDCVKFWIKNAGKKYFIAGRPQISVSVTIDGITNYCDRNGQSTYLFCLCLCHTNKIITYTYPSNIIDDIVLGTKIYLIAADELPQKVNIWLKLEKKLFEQARE